MVTRLRVALTLGLLAMAGACAADFGKQAGEASDAADVRRAAILLWPGMRL